MFKVQSPAITAIIPARLGSTRFPGKVLAARTGKPLIRHVVEAAARSQAVSRVVVAADDRRIIEAVLEFGGEAVLTGEHANGTSRLAEAARVLGLSADSVVVNVQGDEPELEPSLIDEGVRALLGSDAPMATVAAPFGPGEDPRDPNIVKVVRRLDGSALYFSRALIPFPRDPGTAGTPPLKHIGLYVYRRPFLDTYVSLAPTELERTEQLEQLRVLAHGHAIAVAVTAARPHAGIDTPEQYEAFVARQSARR
jgi:3-deoxy-manno-octulosonate cytidylyltransferase (CMP-KDO synthetase)